jgi:hypothetical protein
MALSLEDLVVAIQMFSYYNTPWKTQIRPLSLARIVLLLYLLRAGVLGFRRGSEVDITA